MENRSARVCITMYTEPAGVCYGIPFCTKTNAIQVEANDPATRITAQYILHVVITTENMKPRCLPANCVDILIPARYGGILHS